MKSCILIINLMVFPVLLVTLCAAKDFDFFYFVQQWPASYCDTKKSCCYPTTGKPAEDFGIHGLWPNYADGSYPTDCDPDSPFDSSEITDLRRRMEKDWPTLACPSGNGLKFWAHEWDKHGTCSESVLTQHNYFQTSLDFKNRTNLLRALQASGIQPDGNSYTLKAIKGAIREALGVTPYIECNIDPSRNHQLYQVYLCVDSSASDLIECPVMPHGRPCGSGIEFPSFSASTDVL